MRNWKKLLGSIIALVLCVALFTVPVQASSADLDGGLDGGVGTITLPEITCVVDSLNANAVTYAVRFSVPDSAKKNEDELFGSYVVKLYCISEYSNDYYNGINCKASFAAAFLKEHPDTTVQFKLEVLDESGEVVVQTAESPVFSIPDLPTATVGPVPTDDLPDEP